MVREVLIAIELVAGVGAVAAGSGMLVSSIRRRGPKRSPALVAYGVLIALGVALLCAGGLLLAEVSQARLISVEAGVLLSRLDGGRCGLAGRRHRMSPLGLVLGLAVMALALLLPSP